MKFILNKCKVIQLGKYNLTPWRLGERHLESSNTEQPEGQQITLGFAIHYGGLQNTRLYKDSFQAFLTRQKGRFSVFLLGVPLHVTLPLYAEQLGAKRSHHFSKTRDV